MYHQKIREEGSVLSRKIRIALIIISSLAVICLVSMGIYYFFSPPIKDEVLRKEVLKELDLEKYKEDSSRPNKKDLQKLKTLTIEGSIDETYRVAKLNGLQYATNLEKLVINGNHIENVKPLKKLTKLHTLNLSFEVDENRGYTEYTDYPITDITPLKDLKELKKLHLSSNRVEDFSVLEELTQLEELYVRRNSLDEFPSEIRHLTNLRVLDVNQNSFKSIEPLKELTSLEELYIGGTLVTDFSALQSLTSLTDLYMRHTSPDLKDISFLEGLKNLRFLEITIGDERAETEVDASPINHLKNLEHLVVVDSYVDDLAFISSLPNLKRAYISSSYLTSLEGIENAKNLESLRVTYNNIIFLDPLVALTELRELDVSHNSVTSLKPLQDLENLESLDVSNNKIFSLGPLVDMNKLKYLYVKENNLRQFDIDVMKKVLLSNNKDVEIKM